MMIHKLAKVISAATVLTITASLVPESALAGLGKFPGFSTFKVEFNLDITSSVSTSDGANQTIFKEAIQNPTYQNNFNSIVPDVLNFNPGEVKISLIDLTPEFLQTLNTADSSFKGKFDSKAVKYEASLEDNSNNLNFVYYAPYTDPFTNLNSLSVFNASNLAPFLDASGQVLFPAYLGDLNSLPPDSDSINTVFSFTPDRDDVTKVPELNTAGSLLAFGIVSIVLLRKPKKRLGASISHGKRFREGMSKI